MGGIELNTPKSSDGKFVFLPAQFRGDVQVWYPGSADDIENGIRHEGPEFALESTVQETKEIEFQFGEFVYFVGGTVRWVGATFGDKVHYEVYAPASPAIENVGGGAYAKLPVGGGLNMFVPAGTPGAGGANWDLDLGERLNSNVRFTKVSPVPGTEGACFFGWNESTDAVTLEVDGGSPNGDYHLFDADIVLACFLPTFMLLGSGEQHFEPPSIKSKKMLPHWIHRVRLVNTTSKTLQMVWNLYAARLNAGPGPLVK